MVIVDFDVDGKACSEQTPVSVRKLLTLAGRPADGTYVVVVEGKVYTDLNAQADIQTGDQVVTQPRD